MDLSTRQGRREQGGLVQKAVERAGLSVEELANRIGCSRALIYQYLSGTTLAQPDRLQRIASVTNVPLAYFYGSEIPDETKRGRKVSSNEASRAKAGERLKQYEELAQAQENPADWKALAETSEQLISLAGQSFDSSAEACALFRLGKARIHLGEFSRAVDSLTRAASLFASLKDAAGEAAARQALGNALLATGRSVEARDQFTLAANSSHWRARWSGTVSLAAVDEQIGDYRAAMSHCDDAAAILEEGTDQHDVAVGTLYVNANRVNIYLACGDFINAKSLAERCLAEAETFGNSDQHLEARLNLGVCAYHQGHWVASHRMLNAALPLSRFVRDKSREAMCRALIAQLLAAMGDCDSAIEHAREALSSALSQGDHRVELFAQLGLADAYCNSNSDSEARYHANQALAVANALRLGQYEAEARLRIARISLKAQHFNEAQEHIELAHKLAVGLGARHLEAQALRWRAESCLAEGFIEKAADYGRAALEISQELGICPLNWEVNGLLARVNYLDATSGPEVALQYSERAVSLIGAVRSELVEAGIPDTVLENDDRLAVYALHARLLMELGRMKESESLVQQAAWPPLLDLIKRSKS